MKLKVFSAKVLSLGYLENPPELKKNITGRICRLLGRSPWAEARFGEEVGWKGRRGSAPTGPGLALGHATCGHTQRRPLEARRLDRTDTWGRRGQRVQARRVFGGAPPRGAGRRRWLGVSPAEEGGGSHRGWMDPGGGGRIPPDPSPEQGGSREPTTNSMAVAARSTAGERREVRERQGYEEEGGGAVLRLGSGGDDRLGYHSGVGSARGWR